MNGDELNRTDRSPRGRQAGFYRPCELNESNKYIEFYRIRGLETSLSLIPVKQVSLFAGLTVLDTDPSDLPHAGTTGMLGLRLIF
jgi:hypothetical protein